MRTQKTRIITAGLVAALLGASGLAAPMPAYAVTENNVYVGVDSSYNARVEEATTAYHEAEDRLAEINARREENESLLAELEVRLPEQRQRASQSLRTLYKFEQSSNSLIDLLLSADDFNSFIATVQYLDVIQEKNLEEVSRLVELTDVLNTTRASIEAEIEEANEQVKLAQEALDDAEDAREQARQASLATSMEEEKQRQAALEEARKHEGETFASASGREVVIEAPAAPAEPAQQTEEPPAEEAPAEQQEATQQESAPAPEQSAPATTPATNARDAFIAAWAPRIDAFNDGYPLGGYGATFAAAAYDYGVDPRWSPAIARIESSSGLYCFADHNAWGWGDAEWPDWDTAITSHVRGLGRGYGYTNTLGAAETYCPPNAAFWYTSVDGCMREIWPTDQI